MEKRILVLETEVKLLKELVIALATGKCPTCSNLPTKVKEVVATNALTKEINQPINLAAKEANRLVIQPHHEVELEDEE